MLDLSMSLAVVTMAAAPLSAPIAEPQRADDYRELVVAGPTVTLGQLADLSLMPKAARADAAKLVVVQFGPREAVRIVHPEQLAALVSARSPRLARWIGQVRFEGVVVRRQVPQQFGATANCQQLVRFVAKGDPVFAQDVHTLPCDTAPVISGLRADRWSGTLVAASNLEQGSMLLGSIALPDKQKAAGSAYTMRIHYGRVAVEVPATALQTAKGDSAVFVRDSRGEVFAVDLLEEERP